MAPVAASVPGAALLAPRLQRRLRLLAPRPAEDLDRWGELLETAGCAGVRHGVQQEGGHARGAEELLDAPLDELPEELIVAAVGVRDEDESVRCRERDDCREELAPPIYGKQGPIWPARPKRLTGREAGRGSGQPEA